MRKERRKEMERKKKKGKKEAGNPPSTSIMSISMQVEDGVTREPPKHVCEMEDNTLSAHMQS